MASSLKASAKSSLPFAMAPTKTQTLSFGPRVSMKSLTLTTSASKLRVTLRQFGGRWSVIGFLITFSSFSCELTDLMDSL